VKIKIKYAPLPTQAAIFYDDITDTLMQCSGLGSGKTHNLCMKALRLSSLNRGFPGGLLCPSYKDFKRDVREAFDLVFEENGLKEGLHYKFNKADFEYRFKWNPKPLYIFSGEKPISGPNLAYCLVNEPSLIPYERIKEMLRRVRVKNAPFKQRVLAGTPEDRFNWLIDWVAEMQQRSQTNKNLFKLVTGSTKENIHVDPNYVAHLEATLDGKALKVFRDGALMKLVGELFYYAFERDKVVSDRVLYDPLYPVHVGLDFNVGYMTCSFSQKKWWNNRWEQHFFDELVLEGNSNTYSIADAILARFEAEKMIVTCDSSGRSRKTTGIQELMTDVSILKAKGLNVRFKQSNTLLRKRQLLVNGLLDHGQLKAHPKCKHLIRYWEQVEQSKIDFTKLKDKDHKLTHLSDGADYVLDFEFELPGKYKQNMITSEDR
jgi:hypothetical protein